MHRIEDEKSAQDKKIRDGENQVREINDNIKLRQHRANEEKHRDEVRVQAMMCGEKFSRCSLSPPRSRSLTIS